MSVKMLDALPAFAATLRPHFVQLDPSSRTTPLQGQGFFICHIIVIQGIIRSEM